MLATAPPPEDIEHQLARILDTDVFRRSPSLTRFLRYLVEQAQSGESDNVKEYRVGVDVFDRGQDFDPRDDTIVRVQARNLRKRLERYYASPNPADSVRFVLPKGGYALQFERIVAEPAPSAPPRISNRLAIGAGIVLALAIAAALFFVPARHSAASSVSSPIPSLLVAPFANLSSERDNEYFADGLTDELIDSLANIPGLRVLTRSTARRWKDRELDLAGLKDLGITHVIEGSVRKEGANARIAVRLVAASNGSNLWSHTFDRPVQDAVVTEREIASAVAVALKIKLGPGVEFAASKTPSADAYDLYLKGRYYWRLADSAGAAKGIAYLERSLAIDPNFAPAYVAMAGCYGLEVIYYAIPPAEGYSKNREVLQKALALDDTLSEAHTLLAGVYAWNDRNWNRSELEYRRAIGLAPQNLIAHQYYASFLGALGRLKEADAEMKEAQRVDPLDTFAKWGAAQIKYWQGDFGAAEAILKNVLAQDPDFALTPQLLAEVYWRESKFRESEALLRARLVRQPLDYLASGDLGYTLAKSGRADEAREILKQLRAQEQQGLVPPQAAAMVYLGLNDLDRAVDELWKACEERTLRAPWLVADPIYAPLKQHPKFIALLAHVNLSSQSLPSR